MRFYSHLSVTNSKPHPLRVVLEPWADELVLAPEESIDITFGSAIEGHPQVDSHEHGLLVWAWVGATAVVRQNGAELLRCDQEVPPTP